MKTLIVFDLSIDNPEMRFLVKDSKSRDIIAIHSYRRMEHSAIMFDHSFAVCHEAHEGHEKRGRITKAAEFQHVFLPL